MSWLLVIGCGLVIIVGFWIYLGNKQPVTPAPLRKRDSSRSSSDSSHEETPVSHGESSIFEIPNRWGIGDGSPLLVDRSPEIQKIFDPDNSKIPQRSDSYWRAAGDLDKQCAIAVAYLSHPEPAVRRQALDEVARHPQRLPGRLVVSQVLVDLLADPDHQVAARTAEVIWHEEAKVNCKYAIRKLQDEIQQTGYVSTLGSRKARAALDLLLKHAPDPAHRKAAEVLIVE